MKEALMMQKRQSSQLVNMIILALLGKISLLLFFLNFPLPFLPPYLIIDFSDVPAIMASLIFSPMAGVIVVALKNFLYLLIGSGEPVGVTANILAGVMFVLPVSIIYHKYQVVKSIISGLIVSPLVMAIGMSILNYFVFLPIYAWFMGMENMKSEAAIRTAVVIGILPFNVIKGVLVSFLFVPKIGRASCRDRVYMTACVV